MKQAFSLLFFILLVSSIPKDTPCNKNSDPSCWVYGNHFRNTAYDICAIGSIGCLWSDPEPINITAENLDTQKWLLTQDPNKIRVFIIPGHTDINTIIPIRMSEDEHDNLHLTAALYNEVINKYGDLAVIVPSGGNAHPRSPKLTPYNEAFQMKQILFGEYGIPRSRIIIDSYSQHSTTNLRNVARFMMQFGLQNATIVSDYLQSFYFAHDWISTFYSRCLNELGYIVGDLEAITLRTTFFSPSDACWKKGTDTLDP